MKIALGQLFCGWGEIQSNLERLAHYAEQAAAAGADLVVFPELAVSGIFKHPRVSEIAESLDGPSVTFLRSVAFRHRLAMGFGFSEKAEGKPFNAYCVVHPNGELAGVYRKNHLPKLEVPFWRRHTERPTFALLGFEAAVSICWDNTFQEMFNHYAGRGAQVVMMPHAWDSDALDTDGRVIDYDSMEEIEAYHRLTGHRNFRTHDQMRDDFFAYVPDLARRHRVFALFVNQAGRPHGSIQFVGPSFVVDPEGRVVAQTQDGSEQLLLAEISVPPRDSAPGAPVTAAPRPGGNP